MRLRAWMLAVGGAGVWLAACDFESAFNAYCANPGRCAFIDPYNGGVVQEISQGTSMRPVVVTGGHLAHGTPLIQLLPAGSAIIDEMAREDSGISMKVSLAHGVAEDTTISLRVDWQIPERTDSVLQTDLFTVTPIVVATDGNDSNEGTPARPFLTLPRASQQSGPGDRIFVRPGQYGTIFANGAACDNTDAGLKAGVTIEGGDAGFTIMGPGPTATEDCALNVSGDGQVVRRLFITNFDEGIRITNGGGNRVRVSDVVITTNGTGLVAMPGSSALLERVTILQPMSHGIVVNGGDVQFRQGSVRQNDRQVAGVAVVGHRGTLALENVTVEGNGQFGLNPFLGAGVLMAADAGTLAVSGGSISNSGSTGITISGSANTVTLSNTLILNGIVDTVGIHAMPDSGASIFLAGTTLRGSSTNILVDDFAAFNGGRNGDGGNNTLMCSAACTAEIHDARSAAGPPMYFGSTWIDGGIVGATTVSSSNNVYGITIDHGANRVIFE